MIWTTDGLAVDAYRRSPHLARQIRAASAHEHFASRSPVAVNFGQSVATILAMHPVSAVALRALGLLRFHAEI